MTNRLCFISLSLILLTLAFFPLPISADDDTGRTAADYLYELGLFRGTGNDSDGLPLFELERSPTRSEAIVMLIRLMGLEQEALDSSYSHPFRDTSEWNEPYIAYAYNKGLAKGISDTMFGADDKVTAPMYVTFILRALGYSDSGDSPDFSYTGSVSYAAGLGLVDGRFSDDMEFTRGDAAIISENALSQPLHNSVKTLYQRLAGDGAIKNAPYWNAGKTALMVPVEYNKDKGYVISYKTLQHFFPEMTKALRTSSTPEDSVIYRSDRYNAAELKFIEALSYEKGNTRDGIYDGQTLTLYNDSEYYLLDNSYNILAKCITPKDISGSYTFTFSTRVQIDGAKLNADYHKVVDTVSQNWDKNVFELGEERYKPHDDGSGISYARLVKMNGTYLSDGWYYAVFSYPSAFERYPIEDAEKAMTTVFFFCRIVQLRKMVST